MQDNKCSWLVVQALQRASETQRSVIEVSIPLTELHTFPVLIKTSTE